MRRLATLAVLAALVSPTVASGQNYSFGDWARDQGYSPGDTMPVYVFASHPVANHPARAIDDLNGISEFDWTTRPTTLLYLYNNQLSSIESSDFNGLTYLDELGLGGNQLSSIGASNFSGLTKLERLRLENNQISSIEAGAFSGLTNLRTLSLQGNQISSIEGAAFRDLNLREIELSGNVVMTELNLAEANLSGLTLFDMEGNGNTRSVSLENAILNQTSLATLLDGGVRCAWGCFLGTGIGELDATITGLDLSGIDFADITDLGPLYMMDDLTDLWLVDTQNVDAIALDVLLDNLQTIEGTDTEGILYMTQADFDAFNATGGGLLAAWNAEPGHHVEFLQIGDVNHDSEVNGLDVDPFVDVLLASRFDVAADMNLDGQVNGLDVDPFVAAVVVPEPSTLLLCLIALGVVGGWRKWGR